MNAHSLFLIVLLLLNQLKNPLFAQKYQDYFPNEKKSILVDNFDTNANNWITGNNWLLADLSEGIYSMKCKNFENSTGLSYIETNLDTAKDFEIEASLKVDKGSGALIFGMADNFNHFRIEVNNNKKVIIIRNLVSKGKIEKLFNNKVEAFKPNNYNKITIRKVKNENYIYINEVFVVKLESIELYGRRAGFSVSVDSEISIDNLSLFDISHSKPTIKWHFPIDEKITVNSEKISLEATISAESEIKTIHLLYNSTSIDISVDSIKKSENNNEYLFSYAMPLQAGLNTFSLLAENSSGKSTSEIRSITFSGKEKRLALVLGNSNYPGGMKLKNPVNDARLMEKTLKDLDFVVISQTDANKETMQNAIHEFSKKLPEYNVALFYYAGHGVQIDGTNYIIPVDAKLATKSDCKFEAVEVNFVVEEFEQYPDNINIVILDACRNNPYRSWSRGFSNGFKAMDPASGTIIAFATSEGSTAADGDKENGLFTEELAKQMIVPQAIESVFKKTRIAVEKRSSFSQSPQEWSKLKGDFSFKK